MLKLDHPEEPTTREETKSSLEDSDDRIFKYFTKLNHQFAAFLFL